MSTMTTAKTIRAIQSTIILQSPYDEFMDFSPRVVHGGILLVLWVIGEGSRHTIGVGGCVGAYILTVVEMDSYLIAGFALHSTHSNSSFLVISSRLRAV